MTRPAAGDRQLNAAGAREYRRAMGRFASGVTVVTTLSGDQIHGMTVNGFVSVSIEPPLALVSLARSSRMHDLVAGAARYGVSVLAEDQEALSWHFAGSPIQRLTPEFVWDGGLPYLQGALAHIGCTVVDAHPAGDHTLFIAEVDTLRYRDGRPLLFFTGSYGALHVGVVDDSLFV